MAYIFADTKLKGLKILYFIPSLVCLIIVGHYLIIANDWKKEKQIEPILNMKCTIDGNNYSYQIFREDNGEFSLAIDDNDKMPLSTIDYTSKDTIIESIKNYYKSNDGMCP